jgi:Na+/phosphate symporter
MKRFLIFAALFPPLGMLIAIAAIPEARRYLDTSFTFWMLGIAYTVGLVPALLSATADWALSENPIYFRMIGTAAAGTVSIMAAVAAFNFTEMLVAPVVVLIALMGAIPAAICSWLSAERVTA